MIAKRAIHLGVSAVLLFGLAAASIGAGERFRAEPSTDGKSIVVKDESTGRVIHTIAKPEGLVRETYVLDRGGVVATTSRDETSFWNATDGTLARRLDERVHAVGHAGTRVVTFTTDRALLVRSYPELDVVSALESNSEWGPSGAVFASDDRYVAVEFCNHYPLSDEQFENPVFDATWYQVKIYDVETGEKLPADSDIRLGSFSPDGRYYEYKNGRRYDLTSRSQVEPKDDGGAR